MTNERKQRIVYALALSGPIIVLCGLILIFSLQVRGDLIAGFAVALSGTALPVSALYVDLWWRHFPAKVNAERAYGKSVLSNLTPSLCAVFVFGCGLFLCQFQVVVFPKAVHFSANFPSNLLAIPCAIALIGPLAYPIMAWRLTARAKGKAFVEIQGSSR